MKLDPSKFEVDAQTLQAVIAHRFDVMAKYAKSMKSACTLEIAKLREHGHFEDAGAVKAVKKWFKHDVTDVPEEHRAELDRAFAKSHVLKTTWSMRQELARLWERSTLTTEQLVHQLKDWCERAEKSEVPQLVAFSRRLRSYA